jgi:hypothetical protein
VRPQTGVAVRGARILADYLTLTGYLEKLDGQYRLTISSAAFLNKASPTYLGSITDFLCAPEMLDLALADPAAAVRAGGSPGLANVAPDNPVWIKFAKAMVPWAAPQASHVAHVVAGFPKPPTKVLDIAAGHGLYGIVIAKMVPSA